MKKRLLALVLCLVMVSSLLPITAAAESYYVNSVTITADGVKKSEDGKYWVNINDWEVNGVNDSGESDFNGTIGGSPLCTDATFSLSSYLTDPPMENTVYYVNFVIKNQNISFSDGSNFSATLTVPGYKIEELSAPFFTNGKFNLYFKLTKTEHTWQFKQAGNTLTGKCGSCNIDPVTLTLSASSVTLPESPFNARLEGREQFETATGAAISRIRYDYKGSDGVWHKGVDPVAANAKAGEYQAFVQISNLPRPVESDGVVAMAENPDGTYTADLFVHYTAADPAVTAQTGDNRPIELMMASVAVFSALAAAAFLLDNKRKYSR